MKFVFIAVVVASELVALSSACGSKLSSKEEELTYISLKKNRLVRETIDLTDAGMGTPAKLGDSCDYAKYKERVYAIYASDLTLRYSLSIFERSDMLYQLIQWVRQEHKLKVKGGMNSTLRRDLCMGLSLMHCSPNSNKCECLDGGDFSNYKMKSETIGDEEHCVVDTDMHCNPQSLLFCSKTDACIRDFDYANAKFLPSCTCQKNDPDDPTDPDISSSILELRIPKNTYGTKVTWFPSTELCTTTSGDLPYRFRPRSYQ